MAVRPEKMIHKSLNIFHIRNPAAIWRYIRLCVTGVLGVVGTQDMIPLRQGIFKYFRCCGHLMITIFGINVKLLISKSFKLLGEFTL